MAPSVAIVGAGISGLAAARELSAAGFEVQVFEASERCGGQLGAVHREGFLIERAAGSFVPAEFGACDLAAELGLELEEASDRARKRWVFIDGELQEVPMGPKQLLGSQLLSWRGKFRALAEPLQPNNPGADESIAAFCNRRLGDEVTRALIAPFVTGVLGGDAEKLSLRACFPRLAELEARGGLVRGVAANKVEAVFSRMQGAASAKRGRRIAAPVGGLESLIEALSAELGPRIHTSTSIAGIERKDGGLALHDASGQHHHCDALVLATPASVTASLVAPHEADMAQALREIPYAPMCVVGLGFDTELEHPLDGFGFLVAKGEPLRTLGVLFESSVWSGRAPENSALLRCMMGGTLDPGILELSDEEIVEQACADLRTAIGIESKPSFQHVVRWPRAIPQYTIGHVERAKRIEAGAESLGLVLTSNALWGVSLNDCIAKGRKVLSKVQALTGAMLLLLAIVAGACGGSNAKGAAASAEDAAQSAEPADAAVVEEPSLPTDRGRVEVFARWLFPPALLRRSPGRNSCGVARQPPLSVELMGGLENVAVSADSGNSPGSAQLHLSACQIVPRVSTVGVGETLSLVNLDEAGTEIVVEVLGEGESPQRLGRMPMRVVGQRYQLRREAPAVLRLHTLSDPEDYAYVLVREGAAVVSSMRGLARLDLPVGTHTLSIWHPPVSGAAALEESLEVTLQGKHRSKHTVDLGQPDSAAP